MFSKNLVIGISRASTAQTGILPKTSDVVSEHHFFLSASWPRSRIPLVVGGSKLGLPALSRVPASHSAVLFQARRNRGEIDEQSFIESSPFSLNNEASRSELSGEKRTLLSSLRKGLMPESGKEANDSSLEIKSKGNIPSDRALSQPLPIIQ